MRTHRALLAGLCLAALVHFAPAHAQPGAPVEANRASEAQLDGLKGVGPATTRRILAERERRPFADWRDLIARVRGIGPATAAQLSAEGLTVNGAPYAPPPAPAGPPASTP